MIKKILEWFLTYLLRIQYALLIVCPFIGHYAFFVSVEEKMYVRENDAKFEKWLMKKYDVVIPETVK